MQGTAAVVAVAKRCRFSIGSNDHLQVLVCARRHFPLKNNFRAAPLEPASPLRCRESCAEGPKQNGWRTTFDGLPLVPHFLLSFGCHHVVRVSLNSAILTDCYTRRPLYEMECTVPCRHRISQSGGGSQLESERDRK